ncbi:MAG: antitoxin [Bdellovibrionaceae bacterium]|nr:antitoxin [Pseudobdellovibrionaceae bacterium]
MRTTLDLEKPVLDKLKALQRKEKATLGQLASSLLAEAFQRREHGKESSPSAPLSWTTADMGARVDLADKEAVYRALDAS